MKICDLTQFYSPLSGGVKRYVQEKIAFIQEERPNDEHLLIIPGAKTECVAVERSRIYTIHSPIISPTAQYRALLNLRAIGEIIERERPDIIESADPYQVGWAAIDAGRIYGIPAVAFYHSHFAEAYLRGPAERINHRFAQWLMRGARAYTRNLYNRFEATLVPSQPLKEVLQSWGVRNTRTVTLGVNTRIFQPAADASMTRATLGIPETRKLLLYVGRLAQEKNTRVLFEAFARLARRRPNEFHLLIIGDGPENVDLKKLQTLTGQVSWIPYCADSEQLAQYYRAADLFVHAGVDETFGLVALESQACGTPVVGIFGSNMDRIIFHEQEDWARENSPEALAETIEKFSQQDLATLGQSAARLAEENHAWPRVFAHLFEIYADVSAQFRRRN